LVLFFKKELLSSYTVASMTDDISQLSRWLREAAWPTWLAHGVDRKRGGFFEALDLATKTCAADFRRLRVAARQIYVFSEAHRAGLPGADEAVHIGLAFLDRYAIHPQGGYAWRFDLSHAAIDHTRDLYDHAFVLLAFSSATSVISAATLRPKALKLLDWIEASLPHLQGGYLESLPPALPRRQNPHMHLLEALLAAYDAFGDAIFIERARALIDVFVTRLFDHASGSLPEFFDDGLEPHRENGVFLVEPGHHCEWVWLLHRYQALTVPNQALSEVSAKLMIFVDQHGIDPQHHDLIDIVGSNGTTIEASARLWPQTERLKAEFLRSDPTPEKQREAAAALRSYLRPDGLWHERRRTGGGFQESPAPASSLYHLTAAILVAEQVSGAHPA
jgi:mannose/cellobiose epimerase-like protein (N-acyl-D-glucosamine 2-epimerase family)